MAIRSSSCKTIIKHFSCSNSIEVAQDWQCRPSKTLTSFSALRLVLSVSFDHWLCKVPLQRITLSVTLISTFIINNKNNNKQCLVEEWCRFSLDSVDQCRTLNVSDCVHVYVRTLAMSMHELHTVAIFNMNCITKRHSGHTCSYWKPKFRVDF